MHGYARVLDPENRKDAAGRKKPKKPRGKKEEKAPTKPRRQARRTTPPLKALVNSKTEVPLTRTQGKGSEDKGENTTFQT